MFREILIYIYIEWFIVLNKCGCVWKTSAGNQVTMDGKFKPITRSRLNVTIWQTDLDYCLWIIKPMREYKLSFLLLFILFHFTLLYFTIFRFFYPNPRLSLMLLHYSLFVISLNIFFHPLPFLFQAYELPSLKKLLLFIIFFFFLFLYKLFIIISKINKISKQIK